MYSLFIVFITLIIDAYIQFFFTKNIFGWENSIEERISGLFRNKYVLGQYLSRMYPILLGVVFLTNNDNKTKLKFAIILLFLIDVLVFITGDRTAFLLMTMSSVMILFLANNYKILRLVVFFSSLIVISMTLSFNERVYDRIVSETIQEAGINENELYIISTTHQDLYKTSFKMFLDNKLFGQGPKLFRLFCSDDRFKSNEGCDTHPHNIYMQILSELGLFGLIPVLAAFLFVSYLLLMQLLSIIVRNKNKYLKDYELFFLIAIFITLWPFAPSLSFFSNHFSAIYYMPVAFLLTYKYNVGQDTAS
ncbi:O-antigen ligase family protein [Pelagibacteraceae bacterium]|jgi:O-antigen ligase|nr:O-antigen ligase family protein [Pelagibacteraceae bacterium]